MFFFMLFFYRFIVIKYNEQKSFVLSFSTILSENSVF